jgi:hypothetical protein
MKKPNPASARITRRQLAGAILATASVAQTPPSAASSPEAELNAAREHNARIAEALAKVEVPIAVEPAFHFTA